MKSEHVSGDNGLLGKQATEVPRERTCGKFLDFKSVK
jgi:hypothetical protein